MKTIYTCSGCGKVTLEECKTNITTCNLGLHVDLKHACGRDVIITDDGIKRSEDHHPIPEPEGKEEFLHPLGWPKRLPRK